MDYFLFQDDHFRSGKRLGFWIDQLKGMPVARMLANEKYSLDGEGRDAILKTKEKVYDNIVLLFRELDGDG